MIRRLLALSLLLVVPAPLAQAAALVEVTGFGTNPGNLRMFRYVSPGLAAGRPLVVALHGCTQSAAAYDDEPGWVALADQLQFALLLPQQQSANNANSCFNWFEPGDTSRGSGEALSIKQMVDRMLLDFGGDASRVYVTGLSAGGAMAAAMLAAYPDVFAAGSVVAGLPYRCATTVAQAFSCMSPGTNLTPVQWGDKVRAASTGPWPTVSLWQGTADSTVAFSNLNELTEQWTNVHGTDQTADVSDTVAGYPHRGYRDSSGRLVVETFSITGMNHGQPIDPSSGCGVPAPYILDVGICAASHIASFWGIGGGVVAPSSFGGVESEDGYVKASADGSGAVVGTLSNLAVGRGTDGRHNRAILSFDTSALPDDAVITRAWLTVSYASGAGDPWAGGNQLLVDLRTGCFNACTPEASDWSSLPSATAVATIPAFSSGTRDSTDFTATGTAAVNRTGTTQLKLRFDQPPSTTAYRLIQSGPAVTLHLSLG